MCKSLFKLAAISALFINITADAGVVVGTTRYLYKENSREISAQLENKDDAPYLMKSWVEAPEGKTPFFMVTPPLFRLEAKQKNTIRIFPTANISSAPKDRETVYYLNVMSVPPTDDSHLNSNTLQMAVRHRMRLIYRPAAVQELSINEQAKKVEWRKTNNKIIVKNPTPFFFYFSSIKINGQEIIKTLPNIESMTTKEFTLPAGVTGSNITWKIINDHGGDGSLYSSTL
ncbi:P pilus assembly chaperone PapD [Klebsiella oxytoca]|uniref:P pilus assembly chaperone PapD n=1 Tax=Klebsiella oxytoca TaxID=571 RepID=A0A318FUI9_KLEOX|nr:molecular chaperone [Klebsiella oxytoca]PXW44439.1 P pilus assembly chaperone PapD [Klebsiella oxytoca]HCB1500663.1 molecular chaperone [Klebsiella michiganensis]HCB1846828.1 molecular chaperone [Klebsiella oxytoca]